LACIKPGSREQTTALLSPDGALVTGIVFRISRKPTAPYCSSSGAWRISRISSSIRAVAASDIKHRTATMFPFRSGGMHASDAIRLFRILEFDVKSFPCRSSMTVGRSSLWSAVHRGSHAWFALPVEAQTPAGRRRPYLKVVPLVPVPAAPVPRKLVPVLPAVPVLPMVDVPVPPVVEVPVPVPVLPNPEVPLLPIADVPVLPKPEVPAFPMADVPVLPLLEAPVLPIVDVPVFPRPVVPVVPRPDVPVVPMPDVPVVPIPGVAVPEFGVATLVPAVPVLLAPLVPALPTPAPALVVAPLPADDGVSSSPPPHAASAAIVPAIRSSRTGLLMQSTFMMQPLINGVGK
jgi:hypothetical protein